MRIINDTENGLVIADSRNNYYRIHADFPIMDNVYVYNTQFKQLGIARDAKYVIRKVSQKLLNEYRRTLRRNHYTDPLLAQEVREKEGNIYKEVVDKYPDGLYSLYDFTTDINLINPEIEKTAYRLVSNQCYYNQKAFRRGKEVKVECVRKNVTYVENYDTFLCEKHAKKARKEETLV